METNYITILDFTTACITIIKLTEEEKASIEQFDDMEAFLETLEYKYGFCISNCQWMVTENLMVYSYENGREKAVYEDVL